MRVNSPKQELLIGKLVNLARGDIGLVQRAARSSVDAAGRADLVKVLDYIVTHFATEEA